MKYQSELINQIVEEKGHTTPLLHYESECVESWIAEEKGAYPKLCDYKGEWLNYIAENPIGKFPYVSLSNVTEATVNNVVPYSYKSAILKGNTLVNLATQKSGRFNGTRFLRFPLSYNLNPNTDYFVNFIVKESTLTDGVTCRFKNASTGITLGALKSSGIIAVNTNVPDIIEFYIENTDDVTNGLDAFIDDIMIIEYQEGMENWDIPYFEGMQSVRMPVLTTSNEDGTNSNILKTPSDLELRGIGEIKDTLDCLTGELIQRIGEVVLDGSQNVASWWNTTSTVGVSISIPTMKNISNLVCDRLPVVYYSDINNSTYDTDGIASWDSGNIVRFRILKSKLITADIDGIISYLQSNPITVQYELVSESVKKVDLSVFNQNGNKLMKIKPIEGTMNISTSSDTIQPTFSGEIPVEAITQNLASFIEE